MASGGLGLSEAAIGAHTAFRALTSILVIFAYAPLADLKALIKTGAPLWFQDSQGVSALHAAAYMEREDVVTSLLEAGAIWNAGES